MGQLRVGLLGAFTASREDEPLGVRGAKQRAVLAMLALHAGEVVSETALIDGIWGESPPMAVKNAIQVYIGQWRRVLAEAECADRIERSGSGYCLTMDPEGLDVRRFERLAERGREAAADGRNSIALERFDAALGLWRGEPLQDFVDMPFQQWERVRLEPELVAVTADRVDTLLALGRGPELIASLEALVTKHPYAERFWAQLMHALYRSGRQVESTRAFARAREALADVGLEPGPILRSMEQRVVRQDPDLDGSASPFEPVAPPEALTRLIGRDDEVERLVEMIAKEGDRLVVLTGPGGVGKSRLGTEVARRIAEAGWLPVAYVALSEITDSAVVAASVNGAFGVPDSWRERPVAEVARNLGGSPILVVIDGVEHVVDSVRQIVADLLRHGRFIRVLLTSRVPLGLPGERQVAVLPMSVRPASGGSVDTAPAVQLFLDRCSRAVDGFEVASAALDTVVEICEAVDGLPLALELAAARVGTLGLSGLSRRLGSRLDLLASPHRAGEARHRSLREVLEWSCGLLTDGAKQMLARLSVFAGGFTVTHVEEMWWEESASRTLAAFEELERHSLLSALPSVDEPRFRLLDTIREFALELLKANGEDQDAGRRLVTWVSERIAGSGGRVGVGAMQFEGLEPEVDNVRAAVQWTFDHLDADAAAELCNSLYVWWMSLGRRAELKRWLQRCVVPDISSEILRGRALLNLGRVEAQLSDHRESITHLEASLDFLRGADFLRCQSLLTLAENYSLLGQVARCADTYRTAEELVVSLGNDELMCRLNLSSLYIQINEQRFEEAITTADEILRMDVTRDWADARLLAMTSRAEALRFIMRTEEANVWALRAAETAVGLGNGTAAEFAWSQLASISAVMGETVRCLEFSGLALCATDLGDLDPQSVYRTALSLAQIYPLGGDDDLGMVARKLIQAFEARFEAPALIERERAVFPLLENRPSSVDSGQGIEELTQSMRRLVQELVGNDL